MPQLRQVRVLPTDGRWCTWTESGQIEWFSDQRAAVKTAMLWAQSHRPAQAILEEPGRPRQILCSYPEPETPDCDEALAEGQEQARPFS